MQNRVYIPPPEKILELVKELAIPKKNKSGGSKSTQIKIFKKLKKLGFPFTVENFNLISPKYGKNLFLILLGFFSILSVILLYFSQFSATLIIFFLIFMAYIFYKRISNDLTYQIVQELFMKKNKIHKIIKNEDRDGVEDKIHTFTKDEKNSKKFAGLSEKEKEKEKEREREREREKERERKKKNEKKEGKISIPPPGKKNSHPPSESLNREGNKSKGFITHIRSTKNQEFDAKIANFVLLANFDSFSYQAPASIRFLSKIMIWSFVPLSFLFCFVYTWIFLFNPGAATSDPLIFSNISQDLFICIILLGFNTIIILLYYYSHNSKEKKSVGGVNNATSVAILMSLLERLKETGKELDWCDLSVVFLDTQSYGLKSLHSFFKNHKRIFSEYKDLYIVYLQGFSEKIACLGTKSSSILPKDEKDTKKIDILFDIIKHHIYRLNIGNTEGLEQNQADENHRKNLASLKDKIKEFGFLGSMENLLLKKNFEEFSDMNYYMNSSLDQVILYDPNFIKSHSNEDKITKVEKITLADCVELLFNVILSIDERIEKKIKMGE